MIPCVMTRAEFQRISIFTGGLIIYLTIFAGCSPKTLPGIREQLKKNDEAATEEANRLIADNPDLRALNELCEQVPISENFSLYSKRIAHNYPLTIFFFYRSKDDSSLMDAQFRQYFMERNWRIRDLSSVNKITEFTNEKYRITIQYGGLGENADYSFSCELLEAAKK
jgi:hypothetical protein